MESMQKNIKTNSSSKGGIKDTNCHGFYCNNKEHVAFL
jgi:hypothetical protein